MASAARIVANRINSLLSTGPKSPDGQKRSALNAFKHGLTGRTLVFTEAELPRYEALCREYREQFSPEGRLESDLVQELSDLRWSLNGIRAREANLLALEAVSLNLDIDSGDPDINSALAVAASLHENTKALATLSIYEQRKLRAFEKTLQLLKATQNQRKYAERTELWNAERYQETFETKEPDWTPADDGFVCSPEKLEAYMRQRHRHSLVLDEHHGRGKNS